jgi:hypothetical protein
MRLLAVAAAILAIAAALGTFVALRGPGVPTVPKAQQSPILERAKSEGVIDGYRVRGGSDRRVYEVGDGAVELHSFAGLCGGEHPGPACISLAPLVIIEYRREAESRAQAILRIAQTWMPKAKIKFFEVTRPDPFVLSHTPDARIMLIPRAGS